MPCPGGFQVESVQRVTYHWRSELGLASDAQVPQRLRESPLPWDPWRRGRGGWGVGAVLVVETCRNSVIFSGYVRFFSVLQSMSLVFWGWHSRPFSYFVFCAWNSILFLFVACVLVDFSTMRKVSRGCKWWNPFGKYPQSFDREKMRVYNIPLFSSKRHHEVKSLSVAWSTSSNWGNLSFCYLDPCYL
jgi:hypothetical protein